MKKIFILLILTICLSNDVLPAAYAFRGRELDDSELDEVSAKGFDINEEAVLAMRQTVAAQQNNVAAVVAQQGDINAATINNLNFVQVASSGATLVEQRNIACVVALAGNIFNAQINNINQADILTSAATAVIHQQNISIFIASGTIQQSVSNVNRVNTTGAAIVDATSEIIHNFSYKNFTGTIVINMR